MSKITNRTILLFICFLNVLALSYAYETVENWLALYSTQNTQTRRLDLAHQFSKSEIPTIRNLASLNPSSDIFNSPSKRVAVKIIELETEEAEAEQYIRPELLSRAHQYFKFRILNEPENPIHRKNYVDFLWKHFLFGRASEQLENMIQANICPQWASKWKEFAERNRKQVRDLGDSLASGDYWGDAAREFNSEVSSEISNSAPFHLQNEASSVPPKELKAELENKYVRPFPNHHFGWNLEVALDLQIINGLAEINVDTEELWALHFKNFPESSLSIIDYTLFLVKQNRTQDAAAWIQMNQNRFSDNLYMNFLADELALIQAGNHPIEKLTQRYKALLDLAPNHPEI